jgi:hypothetical protein
VKIALALSLESMVTPVTLTPDEDTGLRPPLPLVDQFMTTLFGSNYM